ncbi:hypothetical protein [Nocardia farcinica]|uniref:hypothetical protein n=1 Tax=Nocardia farcinica TaxID=37329 RepID=UPI002455FF11|nr:hypothetical protein [Nocardia farcinica]
MGSVAEHRAVLAGHRIVVPDRDLEQPETTSTATGETPETVVFAGAGVGKTELIARATDEAHCVSDWGHDLRPDYRRIRTQIADHGTDVPVLATTPTAGARGGGARGGPRPPPRGAERVGG